MTKSSAFLLFLPVFFCIFCICFIESQVISGGNACQSQTNCSACIQRLPECAWCKQDDFDPSSPNAPRCDYHANLLLRKCSPNEIVNPKTEFRAIKNDTLSDDIQLSPQKVYLKMRPKQSYILDVRFRQAKDYPVDLYYLMDLSYSMNDDKDNLAKLGIVLGEEMQKITKNFRLGFGSFVDKPVMPFVNTVPSKLDEPCSGCAAPYGFKHHLSLGQDVKRFAQEVSEAPISGNLDAPEGGFDAILQSIVCSDIIGWRPQARKIVLFSTDSSFHYAGDGKLGGIVKPNDGECYMERTGRNYEYSQSKFLDYPSVSQVSQVVKKNNINLIFAVTSDQVSIYKELGKLIEGSSAAKLANDSSNIVDLVKEEYNKITSTIELRDTANKDILGLDYFTNCLNADEKLARGNKCAGIRLGNSVSWKVNVTAHRCPENARERQQRFRVYPVGLTEGIDVDVEIICECPCENEVHTTKDETICSGNGRYVCGICQCDDSHLGLNCQCDKTESVTNEILTDQCRREKHELVCSGRGECLCGQCSCYPRENPEERVYGTFCECDNFTCDRYQGLICGGHGTCECKECQCDAGYGGKACKCKLSNEDCYFNGVECNGHGKCVCGRCACEEGYWGSRCESCQECRQNNCNKLRDCVECDVFNSGNLAPIANCSECFFTPIVVDKVIEETPDEHICQFRTDNGCFFKFKYALNYTNPNNSFIVHVERELVCPEPVNLLAVILGVIAGIVGLGLVLLLIWKLLVFLHDRRETARFEDELKNKKWDTSGNPIFRQATNQYKNPLYAGAGPSQPLMYDQGNTPTYRGPSGIKGQSFKR